MTINKLELLIGESSFRAIRNRGHYYVDNTPYLQRLTSKNRYWVLSCPCRFGNSLLINTLHELFAGNESLFQSLYIHDHWDWNTCYPVVRLSFGKHHSQTDILHSHVLEQLYAHEVDAEIEPSPFSRTGGMRLQHLIRRLYQKTQQPVVVLIDEYDKPSLDGRERGDDKLARVLRHYQGLHSLYPFCFYHWHQSIFQSQPVFGDEQPQQHQLETRLCGHLWLYRTGS